MKRLIGASLLALTLVGCGEDGSGGGGGVGTPTPTPAPAPAPTPSPTPSPTLPPDAAAISYLHVFGGAGTDRSDGREPESSLMQASDHNLYGVTITGGANECRGLEHSCGTIYTIKRGGEEAIVHHFNGPPGDGYNPDGRLLQGRDGALYGETLFGGPNDGGTVYRITLSGEYSVLHTFGPYPAVANRPRGGLIQARDGNFYGATIGGGPYRCTGGDCGSVFKMTPAGEVTILHYFGAFDGDGWEPTGPLIEGDDGALYGMTTTGGDLTCPTFSGLYGCGTIYKITPAGELTILHKFGATPEDGILPYGGLIRGPDGAFYGTTYGGGGGICNRITNGCGTVFRVTPDGTTTTLHAFSLPRTDGLPPYVDGFNPTAELLLGSDGDFYGETTGGIDNTIESGTIFRLTPSGVKTTLISFDTSGRRPSYPFGGLIETLPGVFYGVTRYNGKYGGTPLMLGEGTVFKVTPY